MERNEKLVDKSEGRAEDRKKDTRSIEPFGSDEIRDFSLFVLFMYISVR